MLANYLLNSRTELDPLRYEDECNFYKNLNNSISNQEREGEKKR